MNFLLNNLDWLAGSLELSGLWLVGGKRKFGFILNACCCLTWMVVAVHRGIYGLLLVAVPAFIINARNYRRWRKENELDEIVAEILPDLPAPKNTKAKSIQEIFSKGVSG